MSKITNLLQKKLGFIMIKLKLHTNPIKNPDNSQGLALGLMWDRFLAFKHKHKLPILDKSLPIDSYNIFYSSFQNYAILMHGTFK